AERGVRLVPFLGAAHGPPELPSRQRGRPHGRGGAAHARDDHSPEAGGRGDRPRRLRPRKGELTVTTDVEEAEEGSSLADAQEGESSGQMRACATSVAPDELPSPGVVTDGIRRAWQVASLTGTFMAGMLNKPGSLVHAQPPTFAQARDRHHECAGHFGAPL